MAIAEITVLVKYPNAGKEEEATVPLDLQLGEFRKECHEIFGVPKTRNSTLILEKTGEIQSDNETFGSASIPKNAVFSFVPEVGGA
ncbi:hypothetical protein PMG71_10370 [Roseofilum sp. BLCC_M154]|uniref:MoaD/ThiS family protein n=1 Tax=Roseofilum acuticapitatum BLCC-M154 TaxID=3022444 RepID=A0ABT7ASF3_9CYAN|nr:hypothetical protein [Roseofilum acuticapitatum]MDJ1169830.1 hypothetical protein [Roseofilum acuticapitatum BLCC-M154]